MKKLSKKTLIPDSIGPTLTLGGWKTTLAIKNGERWISASDFVPVTGFADPYKTVERYCDKQDTIKLLMPYDRGGRRNRLMINLRGVISIAGVASHHVQPDLKWLVWCVLPIMIMSIIADYRPGPGEKSHYSAPIHRSNVIMQVCSSDMG